MLYTRQAAILKFYTQASFYMKMIASHKTMCITIRFLCIYCIKIQKLGCVSALTLLVLYTKMKAVRQANKLAEANKGREDRKWKRIVRQKWYQ